MKLAFFIKRIEYVKRILRMKYDMLVWIDTIELKKKNKKKHCTYYYNH